MALTRIVSRGITDGTISSADLASGVGGKVLQVVSATKTDTFSSSSTSFIDITGYSVSITPTSISSKILIIGVLTASAGLQANITGYAQLVRNSTAIGNGANGLATQNAAEQDFTTQWNYNYLDSPSTTSSTTYKIQFKGDGQTWYVNRPKNATWVGASTITAIEIAG
jgi:hypothetical protein